VPGIAGVGVPTLSEIQAWDITHLENAARDWTATAQHWETSFSSIQQAVHSPGGTVWRGAAAEAAWTRASTDLGVVRAQGVEVLHASAAIARQGASTLSYAKQSVLNAVDDARAAGYVVSENLMVTPVRPNPVSMAQAQLFAADIAERAGQLVAHDKAIAAAITTTSAPLHTLTFHENPTTPTQPDKTHQPQPNGRINALDNTFKQDPAPPSPPPRPPGLPPEGRHPPVDGPLTEGPPSRPSEERRGARHLWDEHGGEWRYHPDDRWHNPHWDYNPHDRPNPEWEEIPIDGLPPVKTVPDPTPAPAPSPPPQSPIIIEGPTLSPQQQQDLGAGLGIAGVLGGLLTILSKLPHLLSP